MSKGRQQDTPAVQHVRIGPDAHGQRLDNYLVRTLKGVPRSYIYRIVRKGEVRVNSRRVRPSHRLAENDEVRIPPVRRGHTEPGRPSESLMQRVREAVVHEDDALIVVNKPSGLAVHGGTRLSHGLIEVLRHLRPEQDDLQLVHRIDRATSGCLVVAKHRTALQQLHDAMQRGDVDKHYLLLARGNWRGGARTVEAPLRKNVLEGGERVVKIDTAGKSAETTFRPVHRFEGTTLLEATLHTGRTHQIRVHAAHLGHPVAGDTKYGSEDFNRHIARYGVGRLFLHAHRLRLRLPSHREPLVIEAPLDDELQQALDHLPRRARKPRK